MPSIVMTVLSVELMGSSKLIVSRSVRASVHLEICGLGRTGLLEPLETWSRKSGSWTSGSWRFGTLKIQRIQNVVPQTVSSDHPAVHQPKSLLFPWA